MNRELKFRVWDKDKKVFLPESSFAILSNNVHGALFIMVEDFENYREGEFGYPNSYEILQYTGLNDKNGNEIYEGYIINWTCSYSEHYGGSAEIVFDGGELVASTKRTFGNGFYDFDGRQFSWEDVEIIGNIYENPELLK